MTHNRTTLCLLLIAAASLTAQTGKSAKDGKSLLAPIHSEKEAIRYAHDAERLPLGAIAVIKRGAAFDFMEQNTSKHLRLCDSIFADLVKNGKGPLVQVPQQYVVSAGAWLYEHPEAPGDTMGQNLAGLYAALHVYAAIVETDHAAKSDYFDGLLKASDEHHLADMVGKSCR
jgi:hypothetical protein